MAAVVGVGKFVIEQKSIKVKQPVLLHYICNWWDSRRLIVRMLVLKQKAAPTPNPEKLPENG